MLGVLEVMALLLVVPYLAVNLAISLADPRRSPKWMGRVAEHVRAVGARLPGLFRFPAILLVGALLVAVAGASVALAIGLFVLALIVIFVACWLHEFRTLMLLGDDAFPGRHDKLIWALLLIVLPPVGVWLFRSYREARWPATKPASSDMGNEFF
jgi:hypothetical protein